MTEKEKQNATRIIGQAFTDCSKDNAIFKALMLAIDVELDAARSNIRVENITDSARAMRVGREAALEDLKDTLVGYWEQTHPDGL